MKWLCCRVYKRYPKVGRPVKQSGAKASNRYVKLMKQQSVRPSEWQGRVGPRLFVFKKYKIVCLCLLLSEAAALAYPGVVCNHE